MRSAELPYILTSPLPPHLYAKPGQRGTVLGAVWVWNRFSSGSLVPWRLQNQSGATVRVATLTTAGYHRTVANNTWGSSIPDSMQIISLAHT